MTKQYSNSDLQGATGLAGDGLPMWATQEEILKEDMKTYSEDEVEALVLKAVAEATGELSSKLASIEADTASAKEAEVAASIAKLDEDIKELHAKLDTAVLEAASAVKDRDDLVAFLEDAVAEEARQAEIAALREDRLAKVAATATFPEEYLQANVDRWAAMTESDFEAAIADYALVGKKEASGETIIPSETALKATKEVTSEGSAFTSIFQMRVEGVDARTIL